MKLWSTYPPLASRRWLLPLAFMGCTPTPDPTHPRITDPVTIVCTADHELHTELTEAKRKWGKVAQRVVVMTPRTFDPNVCDVEFVFAGDDEMTADDWIAQTLYFENVPFLVQIRASSWPSYRSTALVAHETGHVMGFPDDYVDKTSIMYYTVQSNEPLE